MITILQPNTFVDPRRHCICS